VDLRLVKVYDGSYFFVDDIKRIEEQPEIKNVRVFQIGNIEGSCDKALVPYFSYEIDTSEEVSSNQIASSPLLYING
jgi:hypothetical protein